MKQKKIRTLERTSMKTLRVRRIIWSADSASFFDLFLQIVSILNPVKFSETRVAVVFLPDVKVGVGNGEK